ncbi:hypothetical protein RZR97_00745 [Hydrogenimonas thermophila]|uniref:hypothetical protein n=1 Tax=Hydrogenimonas thermophila TaxID=223786 RepID=UPI0029371009|nr:hypothetical protein [Hydrogenimonas thermophila]WOE70123.1 hypothetical protein RZR91_00745 [Hydrogenimonas thermophila]WOE72640.1 hypothetical protein RZR97_00745 [Hydrogenimonas thermophila]
MTIVVANTKGGVGKSIISHMVLPTLFLDDDKTINVYEIDDNNRTSLNLNDSKKLNFKSIKIKEMEDDIDQVKMDAIINDDDIVNIIDCGGGNDTLAILDHLAKSDMEGLVYIVPANDDIEQFENVKQTIDMIYKNDKEARIFLIFNRAHSIDFKNIKQQFIAFFGFEQYGIDGRMKEIEEQIEFEFALRDSQIYGILKNVYKVTLADEYPKLKYTVEKSRELQEEWAKQGKEYFKKKMKYLRFAKDILELVDEFKPLKNMIERID